MKLRPSLVHWWLVLAVSCELIACHLSDTLPDPLEAGWNGNEVCVLVEDSVEKRVLRCTFPPGVGHERHYHDAHIGHTVRGGRMRITDAEGTRVVDIENGYTSDWKIKIGND